MMRGGRHRAILDRSRLGGWVVAVAPVLLGCRAETAFRQPDPELNRMLEVPRYDIYESSSFYPDGMVLRRPPEGTIPYGPSRIDFPTHQGKRDGKFLTSIPFDVTMALLQEGREHFDDTCAACHGVLGDGDTVVATHMQRKPASLYSERVRSLADGKLYFIIENGYGFMPDYASHLDVRARWAVVAYVRALQRSRVARLDALPEDIAAEARRRLE